MLLRTRLNGLLCTVFHLNLILDLGAGGQLFHLWEAATWICSSQGSEGAVTIKSKSYSLSSRSCKDSVQKTQPILDLVIIQKKSQTIVQKAFAREIHIASYCFKVLKRRCKTSILVSPLPHLIPRSQLTVKRKGVLHDFHMQNSQETASKTQSQSYLRGCPQDSREWWSTRQQVHQVTFKWHLKTNYITNTWSASKSSFSPG